MKNCRNCGMEIDPNTTICPNCNINLLQSKNNITNVITKANKFNKILKICVAIAIIILMIFIPMLIPLLKIFGFNDVLIIYNNVIKILLYVGIISLIVSLILYFVKYKNKLIKIIIAISVVLISVSLMSKTVFKIDDGIVLKDYTKANYIELGSEKIPSLYSVIGKRKILTSLKEEDKFDSSIGIEMDSILIIYIDITSEDVAKYKNKLLETDFKAEKISNAEYQGELYIKNNYKDNKFYIVSVDGSSIIYSMSGGKYEDVLEEFLIR